MKPWSKPLAVLASLTLCLSACTLGAAAAQTKYSAVFQEETGIAQYGTVWLYETRDRQTPGASWVDAVDMEYQKYWPTLQYDIAIFKGTSAIEPSKVYADGHLHAYNDDISLTFIAPDNGKINVAGTMVERWYQDSLASDQGDGVEIYIMHNDEQIWPASGKQLVDKSLETPNKFAVPAISDIAVEKGDKIRFVIEPKENPWCDPVKWEPEITFDDGKAPPTTVPVTPTDPPATERDDTTNPSEEDTTAPQETDATGDTSGAETDGTGNTTSSTTGSSLAAGNDTPGDDGGLPVGAIVGIVVGIVAVLAGGGFALWHFVLRNRGPKQDGGE